MEASIWFRKWPQSKIDNLLLHGVIREYRKSEKVYKDYAQKELLLVVSGAVWCLLPDRKPLTKISLLYPSSLIGLSQVMESSSTHDAFEFEAAEDLAVMAIPTEIFIDTVEQKTNLWRVLAESTVRYQRSCIRLALGMYIGPIRDRVIVAIYQFGLAGIDPDAIGTALCVDISQEDLATLLQSSRQHINKTLRGLEQEKLVRIGYKRIEIIDPLQFLALAHELMPLTDSHRGDNRR